MPPPTDATLTPAVKARIAFMRFGLGPKPGGPARIGLRENSALNACLRELENPGAALIPDEKVKAFCTQKDTAVINADIILTLEQCAWFGVNQRKMADGINYHRPLAIDILNSEFSVRIGKHMEPEVGFLERLIQFWSNHFSICERKMSLVRATTGHLERAVIRPNVLGNFYDMLKGVLTHPSMIVFLDNQTSYGPTSREGRKRRTSYNENLAREVLELHTVGIGAGYTQADVTNMANILTGWMIRPANHPKAGQFWFNSNAHEERPFTVMGTSFGQPKQEKGLAALKMLANHPSTAEHIAFKLLLHFVTDTPSTAMVERLASVFRQTNGDLKALAIALLRMPEAWSQPLTRITLPFPWMMAQLRALGFDATRAAACMAYVSTYVGSLNHHPWRHITPEGYPDENYVWEDPNAVRMRKDIAFAFAIYLVAKGRWDGPRPLELANTLFPGVLSAAAAREIAQNKDDRLAFATLFLTPEFQRR